MESKEGRKKGIEGKGGNEGMVGKGRMEGKRRRKK